MTTAAKIRRIQITDRSVRDRTQRAIVMPNVICVQSFVGRIKVGEYNIGRVDWYNLTKQPTANPAWNKMWFIQELTGSLDTEPDDPCQAERIRDSQIRAIDKGIKLWSEVVR